LKRVERKGSLEFDLSVRSPRAVRKGDAVQNLSLQPGVVTLPVRCEESEDEALGNIERRCLHNANVCERLGEHQKKETWIVVSKIVRSRIQRLGQGFDGWGGLGGGSLGVGLIDNILRYYEALGDVQMLSTLVCVLRDRSGQRGWFILPTDQGMRYDAYIRLYAHILYGWHLLTIRAELNKHLVRSAPMLEYGGLDAADVVNNKDSSPGIAFVIKCPRCSNDNEYGANYCRSCRDYSFRCALCEHAVRGLFTVCEVCGHGGHVNHMTEWFTSHDTCPTGCGCTCRLASPIPTREADLSPNILQHSMQLSQ
jgi:Zinc-ribbon, C4HC2 type